MSEQVSEHVDVVIVGAGLSGIGAAYYLQREHPGRQRLHRGEPEALLGRGEREGGRPRHEPGQLVVGNGPEHLRFQAERGGEREAVRVFRLSRIRGKVSYASKAEHDFTPPDDFDRRDYASRADWQMGEMEGSASVFVRERIAWLVERDFGHTFRGSLGV